MKLKQNYIVFGILVASNLFAGQSLVCEEPVKDFGMIDESKSFHIHL